MSKFRCVKLSAIILVVVVLVAGCASIPANQSSGSQPIGIISAMSNELRLLVETADITRTDVIGGVEYHVGKLGGKDVVLVKAGIGKSLAAAGTATLINTYNVSSIVFTGIAGGVADATKVLDMVISTDLVIHDYGTETNDGFVWNSGGGVNRETGRVIADPFLRDEAYKAAVRVVGADNTFLGTIATGDQFIASETYVKELQDKFDAYACEMEGAAVAVVAASYNIPFVVIRCMSDKADGLAHDSIDNFGNRAADNSASIVINMMENMAK